MGGGKEYLVELVEEVVFVFVMVVFFDWFEYGCVECWGED